MAPTALGGGAALGDGSASALPAERRLAESRGEASEARLSVARREQAPAHYSIGTKGAGADRNS
jgi:hypothetical protein